MNPNLVEHPVEGQWHFAVATAHGYAATTPVATGLVRSYRYSHPSGRSLVCTTGYVGDHWLCSCGAYGWHADLPEHLRSHG